jgi:tetratricopeptide (TPR) repeat protein
MVPVVGVGSQDNRFPMAVSVAGPLDLHDSERPGRGLLRGLLRVASFGRYVGAPSVGSRAPTFYLPAVVPVAVPWQVPAGIAGFTGRREQLAMLDRLLGQDGDAAPTMVISAIAGTAGVGKTALAVHWAHRIRDRFPHGQLYVDLRGYGPGPRIEPGEALAMFLQALGAEPAKIPATVEERAALYRSLLADRRMLVVLDNAAADEQVRPLLPGAAGCSAVVTSRSRLVGLVARDGARRIDLDVLSPEESITLLKHIIGHERVEAEPEAAARLAEWCAYLPLALRITAQRAVDRRHIKLAELVRDLATEQRRLDALTSPGDETGHVRGVFFHSYHALPTDAARVWRLAGLHAGPEISAHAVAALADLSLAEARRLLDTLAELNLLQQTASGQYRFHDLLRAYAAECTDADDTPGQRHAALERMLTWYLHAADVACRVLAPHVRRDEVSRSTYSLPVFATPGDALNWYEAERENLGAAARQATEHGEHMFVCDLPPMLWWGFHEWRGHFDSFVKFCRLALAAAHHLNDRNREATASDYLGRALRLLRRLDEAASHHARALVLYRESGNRHGQARVLNNLGSTYQGLARFDEAITSYRDASALYEETSDRHGEAVALYRLGNTYRELRRFDEAMASHRQALAVFRDLHAKHGEALVLFDLGATYGELGQLDEAVTHLQQAAALIRETGDWSAEAGVLAYLGGVCGELGRFDEAVDYHRKSLSLFREVDDQHGKGVGLINFAYTCRQMGQFKQAVTHLEQALPLLRKAADRKGEAAALLNLGTTYLGWRRLRRRRQFDKAINYFQQALVLYREIGDRDGEALMLHALGRTWPYRSHGRATTYLKEAEKLYVSLGDEDNVRLVRRTQGWVRRDLWIWRALLLILFLLIGRNVFVADSGPPAVGGRSGFVLASNPTAESYRPTDASNPYLYSSASASDIEISRQAVGTYLVRFGDLATTGGIAHATAYGDTPALCALAGWGPDRHAELVQVRCFSPDGRPADTQFMVNFVGGFAGTGRFSYLWAEQPTARYYQPSAQYRADSTGGTAWIERHATGKYRVYVPASVGVLADSQFYQVTAYGAAAHCKISAVPSSSGIQEVACRGAQGELLDAQFSLSFSWQMSFTGRTDRPFHLGPSWRPEYVEKVGTGYYVWWQDIEIDAGQAVAYAVGDSDAYCHVDWWDTYVTVVRCWSAATHAPADAEFVVGVSE